MPDFLLPLRRRVTATVKNRIKTSPFLVRHRSRFTNIYHCTVYRTGSQWLRRILSDLRVCRYSGLLYEMHFQRIFGTITHPDRTVTYDTFPYERPFPECRIVGLYASHERYLRIPHPAAHRTFCVLRDPRDIVVSHYFASRRDARRVNGPSRETLSSPAEGIPYMMDLLDNMGLFAALRSWALMPANAQTLLLRFEALTGSLQQETFWRLFSHCDIAMPDQVLQELLEDHSFSRMAEGREPGEENPESHYRKGLPGDWKNHFTTAHIDRFKEITGDLVTRTGYVW